MKLPKNKESGQALVIALILLALGSLLIVPALNLSFTSLKYHQSIESETMEGYSADAGVEYALCQLYNNPGGYTETPLQANFDLNGRTVNVTAEYMGGGIYKVTSTATSANGKSTTIQTLVNLSAGAFAYTVAAKTSLSVDSNATVNSTMPGGADIHSNGNISLGSNCQIKGNASAVGTISGKQFVTGKTTEGAPPIPFPGEYAELYKVLAQERGSYVGNLELSGSTPIDLPGPIYNFAYIRGNLTIKPNTIVRVNSTIYVTGTLKLQSGARLDGQHCVCAEGDIELNGGYRSDLIPVIISKNGSITCKKGTADNIINAVVYAPKGSVSLEANAKLYGAVGGNTVSIGSNSLVTYAAQLHGRQDLPGGELTTIAYSYK